MYKYKYNGKELQDELGLDWYDYQARNYDPATGRRNNVILKQKKVDDGHLIAVVTIIL